MDAVGTQFQELANDLGALTYLPALARVGAVLAVAPPFAAMAVPRRVRALMAITLTIGLMPAVSSQAQPNASLAQLSLGIAGEVLIGLALGMSLALVFTAAQWAGELITQQMGLSLSEVYDPRTGGAVGSLGHMYWLLAVVVFLGANGHHALLRGVAGSFQTIPVMSVSASPPIVSLLVGLLQSATGLAIQLAAPVFVSMLVVDLALGMVFRTMPQLGVMTAGISVRSVAGLVVMIGGLALTAGVVQGAGLNWMRMVTTSFNGLAGR